MCDIQNSTDRLTDWTNLSGRVNIVFLDIDRIEYWFEKKYGNVMCDICTIEFDETMAPSQYKGRLWSCRGSHYKDEAVVRSL